MGGGLWANNRLVKNASKLIIQPNAEFDRRKKVGLEGGDKGLAAGIAGLGATKRYVKCEGKGGGIPLLNTWSNIETNLHN